MRKSYVLSYTFYSDCSKEADLEESFKGYKNAIFKAEAVQTLLGIYHLIYSSKTKTNSKDVGESHYNVIKTRKSDV